MARAFLAFTAAFLFAGCTNPTYAPQSASDIDLPKKLGLSASPSPAVRGISEGNPSSPENTIPETLAPGTPRPTPATVVAKFAVLEVQFKGSSESGSFKIQLFPQIAPRTVENFERKANSKFYDGLTFHRVEDWIVQGGDPKGDGTGGGVIRTELNKQPFIAGSVGMARGSDILYTNDSQFFIMLRQVYGLDEQYTNFGQLIEGAEVVVRIRKGDRIKSIRVL